MAIVSKPSILVIGFPKSGTTTLQDAFEKSGMVSVHWRYQDNAIAGKVNIVAENIYDGGLNMAIRFTT